MPCGVSGARTKRWRIALWRLVLVALCFASFELRTSLAVQRTLVDITDYIESEDLEQTGDCVKGCVRQVANAEARAWGEVDCELRVENLLDHTKDDVAGGALNVVHSCADADGNLIYQVGAESERGLGVPCINANYVRV